MEKITSARISQFSRYLTEDVFFKPHVWSIVDVNLTTNNWVRFVFVDRTHADHICDYFIDILTIILKWLSIVLIIQCNFYSGTYFIHKGVGKTQFSVFRIFKKMNGIVSIEILDE